MQLACFVPIENFRWTKETRSTIKCGTKYLEDIMIIFCHYFSPPLIHLSLSLNIIFFHSRMRVNWENRNKNYDTKRHFVFIRFPNTIISFIATAWFSSVADYFFDYIFQLYSWSWHFKRFTDQSVFFLQHLPFEISKNMRSITSNLKCSWSSVIIQWRKHSKLRTLMSLSCAWFNEIFAN